MTEGKASEIELGIRHFESYFSEQIGSIEKVGQKSDQDSRLHRKILYSILIDTLSRAAFPSERKHGRRFVQFIDQCSGWQDKNRVSAQLLKLALEESNLVACPLYKKVSEIIAAWGPGGWVPRPINDPLHAELISLAEGPPEREILDQWRYTPALYQYRNNLIHEYRSSGYGMQIDEDDDEPSYLSFVNIPWQLEFPVAFFAKLSRMCLGGVVQLLTDDNRDPFLAYDFGSLWKRTRRI
jgi:hypothetical protein